VSTSPTTDRNERWGKDRPGSQGSTVKNGGKPERPTMCEMCRLRAAKVHFKSASDLHLCSLQERLGPPSVLRVRRRTQHSHPKARQGRPGRGRTRETDTPPGREARDRQRGQTPPCRKRSRRHRLHRDHQARRLPEPGDRSTQADHRRRLELRHTSADGRPIQGRQDHAP
jgi:hypothetical protein